MVEDMTNDQASESRANSIRTVQTIIECRLVDEGECVVRDTIANLMHWCDARGMDFEHELAMARDFHHMEKEDA